MDLARNLVRPTVHGRPLSRLLGLALPALVLLAFAPPQTATALAAGTQAVTPMGVHYPAPMPQPKSASAHLPASSAPLAAPFRKPATQCRATPAAPVATRGGARARHTSAEAQPAKPTARAQQSCRTSRSAKADQGYRQARSAHKPLTSSPDWAPVATAQAPAPQARYGAAAAYDGTGKQVLLFGGADTETSTVYGGTWTWNGSAWTDISAGLNTAPPARVHAQAAYDPVHQQVVLFGGSPDGVGVLGDTWIWNGSAWSQASPATAPSPRSRAMMAWDPDLGRIVLYGGQAAGGTTVLSDMWAWDGATWSLVAQHATPGPLFGASMAYDAPHHSLLVFGGSPDGVTDVNTTWSFDGTVWKRLGPSTSPPAREGAGVVFDAGLGKVVLTSGADMSANTDLNDTWTWDGSTWSQLSGIASPAPRQDFGLAYDNAAGQVVMMGGSFGQGGTSSAATFSDTDVLGLGAPTLTESVDKGANGLYPSGGTATYTLTVGNSGLLSSLAVSVTDQFPASMALASAPVGILDVGTGASIACGGGVAVCTTSNNTLSITGLLVGVLDSFKITFSLVVVGLGRQCSDALDDAIASSLLGGSSPPISIPITICDTGLGVQPWWSFVSQSVGPQAEAKVNVSNGNLVVQQRDSTPVQAHGHLAYGLDRTYNSQDTTLLSFPGSFGAGWSLDIPQTGDLAGLGVGSSGLFVPPLSSVLDPLAVTLIEPTGTRDVFQFKGLNATIDLTGLLGGGGSNLLASLLPSVLSLDTSKFNHLCVDETFSAPPGVHLGLYRYIEVQSGNLLTPCSVPDPGTTPVLLGFATVSPERVRDEFSFDGHLLDVRDSSGTDLRYQYAVQVPLAGVALGPLQQIFEPRSCGQPLASTCRAIRFQYGSGETDVTDPAGRVTRYFFDNTPLTPRLIKVANPDGSIVQYAYQQNAFSGVDCGGSANQLCSITDNRGNTTTFTYTPPPLIGLDKVATMADRRGTVTTFTYSTSPDSVTADTAGHRQRFQNIDESGRVAEIDEGDTSNNFLHQTLNTWDVPGATCRQPDAVVDNNLCRQVVKSLTSATPDEDMTYTYNPEGAMLHQHWASPALDETSGFHAQYFEADGSVKTFDDTVAGSGVVNSGGPSTGRSDGATLYAISDPTQSLSPRGNAAGSGFAAFLTSYKVDDNSGVIPSAIPPSNPCADPNAPTSNTGDICEVDAPSFDGGAHPTVTRSTYDTFGEKLTMTTPLAIQRGQAASYTYTYYADSALDVSGNVSAGGWLKGITDPTGNFVAFAYDRAGNVVRTWDRNATQGHTLADFPGTIASPPSAAFTETLYGTGSTAYSAPWRYVRSQRDQLGDLTTFTVDANGNQTAIRPPRGNQAGTSSFDVTQTFDQNDNLLTTLLPLEVSANKPTSYTYDAFDNRTSKTDPDGNVTTTQFDSANRAVGSAFTRGPFPSDTSQVPPACRQSTSADAPIPAGRILCSTATSYDGVDNKLSTTDGNHQVTTYTYDGIKRPISQLVPRNADMISTVRTDTVYNADGHVTDVCPPNEFTAAGANACTSTGAFSTHRTYDVAGRQVSQTTFRAAGQPDTSTFAYDADGNQVSMTDPNGHVTTNGFDLLDRKTAVTTQRDATTTNTTTLNYDPVGNTTAIIQPGTPGPRITASAYDAANRLTDTVQGADNVVAAQAGLPDALGGTNSRTRVAYDADGHAVAQFTPSAFATSTTSPNPAFMTRTNVDQDGRTTAVFQPRFDAGSHSDLGLSGTQTGQCTTNPSPQAVPGVPGFPTGVGVCVTTYQYDAAGRHTRTVLPTVNSSANAFVDYAYTDDGLTASVSSPSPAQNGARVTAASYLYDGDGKQVKQTDALGHQQTTSYTSDERVAQQAAQPNGSITHVTKQSYDANGNPTTTTDPIGNKSTISYYTDNLTLDSIDGAGDDTRYVYDAAGNLTQKFSPSAVLKDPTNPAGIPTTDTYTFDNLLLTTSQAVTPGTTPDIQRTTYGYDGGGRKLTQTIDDLDSTGHVKVPGGTQTFSYFNNDRLNLETGRQGETIAHAYDPNGNETSTKDSTSGGSTVTSTFYLDNQVRSVDDASRTSQYTYDGEGQQAAMATQVDGSSSRSLTTYTFGEAEQTQSMTSSIVGGGSTSFTYDAVGRLGSEKDPNGQTTQFTFNPDDTLASKKLSDPSGSAVAAFNYAYDGNFQITSQTFTGQGNKQGSQTYTYDTAGRLASFTDGTNPTQKVMFDHDGNRLSVGSNNGSSSYNPDDTLASIKDNTGAVHPQLYSFRGDLQNDGCFKYTYDGFDRMTSVSPTGTAGCPSTPAQSYTYDGLNRQRTTGSTALHYDGTSSLVSSETSASGTDTSFEISPDGQAKAVAAAGGTPQYMSDDGQGNITTVTSSSGTLDCSVRYDPWGSPLAAQSPTNPCDAGSTVNDHFYRGQRLDPVTGNYQLGNRAYSPSKASFINPDTYRIAPPSADLAIQADPLTQNRYAYVNGDPVNLYDPTGHCGDWWNPSSWGCHAAQAYNSAKQWVQQQVNNGVQAVKQVWHDAQQTVGNAVQTVTNTAKSVSKTVTQGVRQAWHATAQFVVQHKADIAGIAAGIAVGVGCEIATAGVGTLGCAALAGAVGSAVQYSISASENHSFSWGGLAVATGIGALTGLAGGVGGEVLGAVGGRVLSGVASKVLGEEGGAALGEVGGQAESTTLREAASTSEEAAQPTLAESCAVNSFAGSTPVLMANGTEKQIKDVKVGDHVQATDPQTGKSKSELVQRVIVGKGLKHLVDITVPGETVEATYNHPFWVPEDKRFEWATDLKPGMHVLLASGATLPVLSLSRHDEITTVYNLSIQEIHTFFVGLEPLLVHNMCANAIPGRGTQTEVIDPNPVRSADVTQEWEKFLGPGPYSNIHPRTGVPDPDRLVSADMTRSIRFGPHEMNSPPNLFHYHEETWTYDPARNVTDVLNRLRRIGA